MSNAFMRREEKVFVAGGSGMVGGAIIRRLVDDGFSNIVTTFHGRPPVFGAGTVKSRRLDLRRQAEVEAFFSDEQPAYVFLAAARVGGIFANSRYPADFIYDNLAIQTNIVHAAYKADVRKLLFLGSSCIYPKFAPQPMKEEHLLTGVLEPTNEPYAVAKIAGIKLCQSYNRQYGTNFISAMPTNLYGPGDNFDLANSHVLPAMMRKFHEGKLARGSAQPVTLWGSGSPRREFLHVDDLADACLFLMRNYDADLERDNGLGLVNVGTGEDVTIKELSELVRTVVGYEGAVAWDATKPDGTPRKLLDVSLLSGLGWKAGTGLEEGIRTTYAWYLESCRRDPEPGR